MPKARFSVLESAQRIKVAYLQPRTIVANLGLAAVYFGVAKFGLSMAVTAEQVSTVWPPTGVALAAILVFGYRVWPGIWLGAFLANATANEPISVACGIAVGNTLEAMIGVWLLGRVAFDKSLERLKDVLGLILIAAGLSTTVSAAIGVICLCLGGVHSWSEFGAVERLVAGRRHGRSGCRPGPTHHRHRPPVLVAPSRCGGRSSGGGFVCCGSDRI